MRAMVCFQAVGHGPLFARCSNSNCSLRKRVKPVEFLCISAQHTGTQIIAPFLQAVKEKNISDNIMHQDCLPCFPGVSWVRERACVTWPAGVGRHPHLPL